MILRTTFVLMCVILLTMPFPTFASNVNYLKGYDAIERVADFV